MSAFSSASVTSSPGALTTTRPSSSVPLITYTPPSVMVTVPSSSAAPLPVICTVSPPSRITVASVRSGASTVVASSDAVGAVVPSASVLVFVVVSVLVFVLPPDVPQATNDRASVSASRIAKIRFMGISSFLRPAYRPKLKAG